MTANDALPVSAPLEACVERPDRPYPGLRPFEPDEWSIFCGRELSVRETLYMLGDHGVVFVHGGSGCGKSSLIAAGVLPSLRRDIKLSYGKMADATIRPSHGPLSALAAVLADRLGFPQLGASNDKKHPSTSTAVAAWTTALLFASDIGALVEQAVETKELDLFCLVVDQFEEIFAWARERRASDVQALVEFLAAVRRAKSKRFAVIVTMRSDFLSDCAQFPALSDIINTCQYYVPNLDERGLERAIREPAAMYNGEVKSELVVRLMTEASGNVDALPVLQHALMRMAERKDFVGGGKWSLGLDDYDTVTTDRHREKPLPVGQRDNALTVHAEEIRAGLHAEYGAKSDDLIETVFRALFVSDGSGHVVRNPTTKAKLEAIAGPHSNLVRPVVDAYARDPNTLLVVGPKDEAGDEMVDISHEALLRNWRCMTEGKGGVGKGWIQQESDDALAWRTLADLAATEGALLDGATLAQKGPLYAKFAAAPERVRRYLLRAKKLDAVKDEDEWKAVAQLMSRSEQAVADQKRRSERRAFLQRLLVVLAFGALIVGGLVLAYLFKGELNDVQGALKKEQDQLATTEANNTRLKSAVAADDPSGPDDGIETTITDVQATALQQIAPLEIGTVKSGTTYMWIGGGGVTNLLYPGTDRFVLPLPNAVRRGARYQVTRNVALRETMPDSGNRSGRQVGAVKPKDIVVALAEAREGPRNGQYWLLVRPEYRTTVYIQYATGNPAALRAALGKDYDVPAAQQLPIARGLHEVRYCRTADKAVATRIARVLTERTRRELPVLQIGGGGECERVSRPGVVEVWIGNPTL